MFKRSDPQDKYSNTPTCYQGKSTGKIEYLSNGIKVLDRHKFAPIHMMPGDTLSCKYTQEYSDGHTETMQLATYTCERYEIIDTAIIVELDNGSLRALGLESGYAGIFGKSKDD